MINDIFSGIPSTKSSSINAYCIFFENNRVEVLSRLPFALSELVSDFTPMRFFEFMESNSGKKVYVARDLTNFSKQLNIEISNEEYIKISNLTDSSGYIEIPTKWGVFQTFRKIAYEEAFKNGMESDELVSTFGISHRTIRTLKKRL